MKFSNSMITDYSIRVLKIVWLRAKWCACKARNYRTVGNFRKVQKREFDAKYEKIFSKQLVYYLAAQLRN